VDDQQRVVDRQPESDELDELGDVRRRRDPVCEQVDDSECRRDREGSEDQWNEDGE
jgi:hypothetical protein